MTEESKTATPTWESIKKEAFQKISSLEKMTESLQKKRKIYSVINYSSLAISLALDFAPAFVQILQSTWYSIPTVGFSLMTLLLNIHLDKESYDMNIRENNIFKSQLTEIIDSINRKNRKRSLGSNLEFSEDYIKRLQSKLSSIKLARGL